LKTGVKKTLPKAAADGKKYYPLSSAYAKLATNI
jgi:hypothetical protein